MKTSFSFLAIIFLALFTLSSFTSYFTKGNPDVTAKFQVNGMCGTCKKTIETSLRVKGVKKVNWDIKSHDLTITYSPDKISIDEIHQRIAAVGYDTDTVKASDAAYSKLDECCKYERK